ncbi:major facilitator superfamily domain-containing protein [Fennellomyces sp. T-0311]|nr:major facilitator superfamily domain-containing protein [Fennellomyces sp. T-0311]
MYLLCKLLYITVFALLSAAPPYLQLYYHDALGFSSDQIGFVLAIAPFIQSLACPVWTCLVDKRPKLHGIVMALTSLVGCLAVMGIMVLGHSVSTTKSNGTIIPDLSSYTFLAEQFSNSNLVWITSGLALMLAFFTLPNVSLVDSAVMKILGPNKILYGEQRLWGSVSTGLTILLVGELIDLTGQLDALFWVFGASTAAFIVCALMTKVTDIPLEQDDSLLCPASLDDEELAYNPEQALLGGPNTLPEEKQNYSNYQTISPYDSGHGHGSIMLAKSKSRNSILSIAQTLRDEADDLLEPNNVDLSLAISRVTSLEHAMGAGIFAESSSSSGSSSQTSETQLFKSPRVLSFLTTTLLFGVVLSMIVNFLFLFLNRDLHTPTSWIGWTGPLGGVTELLCFCFSKQMTEYLGTTGLVIVAHAVTVVRCLSYTLLPPDSLSTNISALLLQTLHGIGFGIFWGTAVSEMDDLFPPAQRAMAQGVLGALHTGLGTGLGALIGGYLYEYFGPLWLFRSAALLACFSTLIFCIGRLSRFDTAAR